MHLDVEQKNGYNNGPFTLSKQTNTCIESIEELVSFVIKTVKSSKIIISLGNDHEDGSSAILSGETEQKRKCL